MSEGLTALEDGRWEAAQEAFERASRQRPGTPDVADGLTRAAAGRRLESVAAGFRQAQDFERAEAWRNAEKAYAAVLAVDPEAAMALEGRKRAGDRADFDERIEYHILNPDRLATTSVFDDAASVLEEAREITPKGPRLEAQIARLGAALACASTPVAVVLESDNLTEVLVYRVGRLGTFSLRELLLRPGTYTVVGSREGFRDVRLTLVVTPQASSKPLVVRCIEGL
jgi:tetratricopeptide (TPR) repeat protein